MKKQGSTSGAAGSSGKSGFLFHPVLLLALLVLAAGCAAPYSPPIVTQPQTTDSEAIAITDKTADCAGDTMAIYGHIRSTSRYNATIRLTGRAFDARGGFLNSAEKTLDLPAHGALDFMIWIPEGCPSLQVGDYSLEKDITFLM